MTGWFEGTSIARPLFDCEVLPGEAPRAPAGFQVPARDLAGRRPGADRAATSAPGGAGCAWQRIGVGRRGARLGRWWARARCVDILASDAVFTSAGAAPGRASSPPLPAPVVGRRRLGGQRGPACPASTSRAGRRRAGGSSSWGSRGAAVDELDDGVSLRGRPRRARPDRGRLPLTGLRLVALRRPADRVAPSARHRWCTRPCHAAAKCTDAWAVAQEAAGAMAVASQRPRRASGSNVTAVPSAIVRDPSAICVQWKGYVATVGGGDRAEPGVVVERRDRARRARPSVDDLGERQLDDVGGAGILEGGDQRVDRAPSRRPSRRRSRRRRPASTPSATSSTAAARSPRRRSASLTLSFTSTLPRASSVPVQQRQQLLHGVALGRVGVATPGWRSARCRTRGSCR